jgi:hypothetical protein
MIKWVLLTTHFLGGYTVQTKFKQPKTFGEILDLSFSISKDRFKDFFIILLLLMGPVYLLQAIIQMVSGTSFFREAGTGNGWFEQMLSSFDGSGTFETTNIGAEIGMVVIGLISLLLFPIAEAAILFAVNHIQKDEEYTIGSVIKQALSRFWAMLGSNILFGLIIFGFILVPVILIFMVAGAVGQAVNPIVSILLAIVFVLGVGVLIAYILTRLSFYFASVVLEEDSPGFSRSFRLTKKRTWTLMGLYIIFYLIISIMSSVVEMTFGVFLGNSVLLSLITNLMTIITTLIFSVGYAVMYFDLKIRHNADDIKDLIEEYKE